jgi:hypothetical protein
LDRQEYKEKQGLGRQAYKALQDFRVLLVVLERQDFRVLQGLMVLLVHKVTQE